MANAKAKRIEDRQRDAEHQAQELGHNLGEWKETLWKQNRLSARCTNIGCSASAQVGTTRKGVPISGDIVKEKPVCRGRKSVLMDKPNTD